LQEYFPIDYQLSRHLHVCWQILMLSGIRFKSDICGEGLNGFGAVNTKKGNYCEDGG
jgi:hypothetical protein